MQTRLLIRGRTTRIESSGNKAGVFKANERRGKLAPVHALPMPLAPVAKLVDPLSPYRTGDFLERLPPGALREFNSMAQNFSCDKATLLIKEEQEPASVLFLIKGKAKLSISSITGRRLIVRIATPGEILGLTSAISGRPYEITAEALYPCDIASMPRQSFLDFLFRNPEAFYGVAQELSLENRRIHEQLRNVGLAMKAPAKLARLLMDWCMPDKHSRGGARWVRCPFTHDEIAEHIGVSRETVTRCMIRFRKEGLVQQKGSVLIIPNPSFLVSYTGSI